MARNFRDADSPADSPRATRGGGKKRGLNPMFVGIIIGLLAGLGLALGFAVWLHRENNPFIEKTRPVEALPTIPARTLQPHTTPVTPPVAKGDADKPRFDFYKILPEEKNEKAVKAEPAPAPKVVEAPPKVVVDAKPAPETKAAADAKALAKAEPKLDVKPASAEVFYLQAGAFQSATDADNLKAKIAFAGFEALVRPVNLPDKGTLFRVRLGPYRSQDEVNRIKASLSQGGINVVVVKGSD